MAEWEGELYFAERFFDHTANIQTDLFWQRDMVTCFRRPLRNPLPKYPLGGWLFPPVLSLKHPLQARVHQLHLCWSGPH